MKTLFNCTPGQNQKPVKIFDVVWTRMNNADNTQFMMVPLKVVEVRPDGTYIAELEEGEA